MSEISIYELRHMCQVNDIAGIHAAWVDVLRDLQETNEELLLLGWLIAGENNTIFEPGDKAFRELLNIHLERGLQPTDTDRVLKRLQRKVIGKTSRQVKTESEFSIQNFRRMYQETDKVGIRVMFNRMLRVLTPSDEALLVCAYLTVQRHGGSDYPAETFLLYQFWSSRREPIDSFTCLEEFQDNFEQMIKDARRFFQAYAQLFQKDFQLMMERGDIQATYV